MKKWVTLTVLGVAVAAAGLSSRVAAQPEPSEAEVNAQVDARLHEVLGALLKAQRTDTRTAALAR